MKILAIRGCNLASLGGRFEVNLAAEPFASAGLFAITGPTGAGKSTLLDALCLALFDRTPRLDGRGGAWVGRTDPEDTQRVRAADVRGLLTRGQGSGFAEVDFSSRDGRRWRSRWEVRRARERAAGRLQQQTLVLEDLDSGDRIGGTKTEVLQALEDRIGLSFDQFRRSVLLAQGDFAAFLHAAPKERAELLEKVTGMAIYAQLSAAAFARAKVEREALESLARQRADLGLLSPEDRQTLEQEASAASAALIAAKQALKTVAMAVEWYLERSRLGKLEATGQAERAEAVRVWEGGRQRRETLDLVKAAQPLRSLLERQDTATRRRDEARQRVAIEGDGRQVASEAMTVAGKQLTEAQAAQERAKEVRDLKTPELEQAALLDDRLVSAQRAVEAASTAADAATCHAQEATARAEATTKAADDEKKKRAAADRWLLVHPDAQALSGAWKHVEAALAEHARASRAVAAAGETLPALEAKASGSAEAASRMANQAEIAERKLIECQQAVDRAEAAIPQGKREQLEAQRILCGRRREALRSAEEALATARRAHTEQQDAEHATEKARRAQQAALEAVERIGAAVRDHEIRLDEAEGSLRSSQAVRDLEQRRADLADGEPCPLCGSTSHPFRREGAPPDALAGQQQRVHELKQRGTRLTADLATSRQQAKTSETEAKNQIQRAAKAAAQLAAPRKSWEQALDTLCAIGQPETPALEPRLPEDPLAATAAASVEHALAATQRELDDLALREQEQRDLEKEAKEKRSGRDRASKERDERMAARERAKEGARLASDALARAQHKHSEERARLAAALSSLETSLGGRPDWPALLEADGEAFRAACQNEVLTFRQQSTAREGAIAALAESQPHAAAAAAEAKAARAAVTAQEEKQRLLLAALGALRAERTALLDGQPVVDVRAALDQASINAERTLDAAIEDEREMRARSKAAEAKLEAAHGQLRKESSAMEDAQHSLQEALAEHAIGLETLRQRLDRDEAWCDAEVCVLDEIDRALRAAESVLKERRERREEHERTDCPDLSEEEATAQQEIAAKVYQEAEQAAQEQQLRIKQDDAARATADALATEFARQEARYKRWEALNEVIGSHDGGKFRKFAQGLTLDSLLGYANVHLRDLSPRYHLERVPGEDLELQVIDRDMGDEIRSINSLSGGETFLASLALALGLSSLSASDTPVESLFIDEGFGTLDLKTLEVALSAFDALHASGRQVGIISHVQDLDQRIGVQVRVVKMGAGRSRIETVGGL